MAVNIIKKNKGIKGTNIIEHHRNPSGRINKIYWLLSESKRDINKIHELVCNIIMSGYDMISSWLVAECIAVDMVYFGIFDYYEYVDFLYSKKYNEKKKRKYH